MQKLGTEISVINQSPSLLEAFETVEKNTPSFIVGVFESFSDMAKELGVRRYNTDILIKSDEWERGEIIQPFFSCFIRAKK